MKSWTMRWYEVRKPGMRKNPSSVTKDVSPAAAAQAVTNLLHHTSVTRVEFVSSDFEPDPVPPVKAQKLEWSQVAHPDGELWFGSLDGTVFAEVFATKGDYPPQYSLRLGPVGPEPAPTKDVEAGKRAAQRALNKFVQMLVMGEN